MFLEGSGERHTKETTRFKPKLGHYLVVVACALWALEDPISHLFFPWGWPLHLLIQYKLIAAVVLVAIACWITNRSWFKVSRKDWHLFAAFGVLGMGSGLFLYQLSIIESSFSVATFLKYLAPIGVFIVAREFLGARPNKLIWIGMALTIVGTFFITKIPSVRMYDITLFGVFAGIGAMICLSCFVILGEKLSKEYNNFTILFYGLLMSALLWKFLFPGRTYYQPELSVLAWIGVVVHGGMTTALPYYLVIRAISEIGAAKGAILLTLEPMFRYFVLWAALSRPLTSWQWIGAILILFGMFAVQMRLKRTDVGREELGEDPDFGFVKEKRVVQTSGQTSGPTPDAPGLRTASAPKRELPIPKGEGNPRKGESLQPQQGLQFFDGGPLPKDQEKHHPDAPPERIPVKRKNEDPARVALTAELIDLRAKPERKKPDPLPPEKKPEVKALKPPIEAKHIEETLILPESEEVAEEPNHWEHIKMEVSKDYTHNWSENAEDSLGNSSAYELAGPYETEGDRKARIAKERRSLERDVDLGELEYPDLRDFPEYPPVDDR